jgi:hypothetical protein
MKIIKLVAVASMFVSLISVKPADAATPGSSSLSKTKRSVAFSGTGTFMSPWWLTADFDCNFVMDPTCDHFALKINLSDGAKISVTLTSPDAADADATPPKPYNDFDVYVYPPGGSVPIAYGADPGNDKFTFLHQARYRNKAYDFAIRPYLVMPGTKYKATVSAITLGSR